jgi:hypothetical protein
MADFCKECNKELFDFNTSDFAGITTKEQTKKGIYAEVLCESCGFIHVDHEGKKIDVIMPPEEFIKAIQKEVENVKPSIYTKVIKR